MTRLKEFETRVNPKTFERLVKESEIRQYIKDIRQGEQVVVHTRFGDQKCRVVSDLDFKLVQ